MNISEYIQNLNTRFKTGISREHSYRGDLQTLLSTLLPGVLVTNEPARIACGAPDYILTKKDIPIGYIEAKDIGVDLNSKTLKEQFDRYRESLNNLIITDYLDFHFYKEGSFVTKIAIAEIQQGKIVPLPDYFAAFTQLITNFADSISQTIKSPSKLAEMMASRAKLMADVIESALNADDEAKRNSALKGQMQAFKSLLIHDITNRPSADIYAQTIAYGLFAARYHDPTLPTFSRYEAATLIPKSNPFLRRLFQDIAGYDLDTRLVWIVDELVQIFLASDVADIMHNFGTRTKQEDPVIHFYETFLAAYDPALRKARGVWYTPEPVVNFIVRAVDDILKTEFGLAQGLADTSKIKIKVDVQGKAVEKEVHKVQILDPATGTGTFLVEVVRQIYKKFEGQKGIWSSYVENNLIPRLNGFELLMASYAMAHLKLDLLLTETGYKPTINQRFRVYLTNSLEESHPDAGTLFSHWLSDEANEANEVKRDTPVMCVIGNPPYAVSSTNKNEWIQNLISDYKKDLNERKINLDDDYIKFIRYGQHYIDKNGSGILAYISNNSFIDGITHRQMRKNLLESFDKIYILDLHGNAKKKEVCTDGSADQNVFDIMQGVSINIFVKTGNKKKSELGQVFHSNLQGKREFKYETLNSNTIKTFEWKLLEITKPNFLFIPMNLDGFKEYENGFKLSELYIEQTMGVLTSRDNFVIDSNINDLEKRIIDFTNKELNDFDFQKLYNLQENYQWKVREQRMLVDNFSKKYFQKISYRPFDTKYIYYQDNIVFRSRKGIMRHLMQRNISLNLVRLGRNLDSPNYFISNKITDKGLLSSLDNCNSFPLYLYPETDGQQTIGQTAERTPNLNTEIVKQIAEKLGLTFTNEKETTKDTFAPIDILDYIYAVLHSPTYREKYKEFLKIDFPRVPYPKEKGTFWQLVKLGGEIRQIHLLESPIVEEFITQYPIDGDNVVKKVKYDGGKVYINDSQYFDKVPVIAWEFYIGGYQPAQKWLKDRKGRKLDFDDILHYQKIIVALAETARLMGEVDKIDIIP
ncbi:MAG: N-6 DNA methylase [Saprospiraceae bacterium]|nr:N-6 DNA methylase [Saprospiraceae bacterium]